MQKSRAYPSPVKNPLKKTSNLDKMTGIVYTKTSKLDKKLGMLYIPQIVTHPERTLLFMNQLSSKQYLREFLIAMAAYSVVIIVSFTVIHASPSSAWWRIPLALVPVIPILFALRAFLRAFHRMDELQRRIHLEAFALSFGITCVVTFSYGLLGYVGLPSLNWVYILPLMTTLWGIGLAIATRRYK
jgi:hypothetical protein